MGGWLHSVFVFSGLVGAALPSLFADYLPGKVSLRAAGAGRTDSFAHLLVTVAARAQLMILSFSNQHSSFRPLIFITLALFYYYKPSLRILPTSQISACGAILMMWWMMAA